MNDDGTYAGRRKNGMDNDRCKRQAQRTKAQQQQRQRQASGTKRFGYKETSMSSNAASSERYIYEVDDKASWKEIYESCCLHSPREWGFIAVALLCFCAAGYLFLVGIALVGDGAKVMAGCLAGELLGSSTNPVTNLMVGILATVLLQSSTTTTAVVVTLTEVNAMTVGQGIFVLMGANIGTSVTSTIVSLGHMRSLEQLDRGFMTATAHDTFNYLTVLILFPLECATGFLDYISSAVVEGAEVGRPGREHWEGPLKKIVKPFVNLIIMSNKKVIQKVAVLGESCESFYPVQCDPAVEPSYETCKQGLISCDKKTNKCPLFFRENATLKQDQISGGVCFFLGLFALMMATLAMIHVLQKLLFGMTVKVVNTMTHCNGYIAIAFGAGITMLVESSSTVTSFLVPFGGLGIIRIEQLYPMVVGANLGTSMSSVISALDSTGRDPLQVALANIFFNLSGFLFWYPLPPLRYIPIYLARRLGANARMWRMFPLLYLIGAFFLMPLFFLGLSMLYTTGRLAGGILLTLFAAAALLFLVYWCKYRKGWDKYVNCVRACERKKFGTTVAPNNNNIAAATTFDDDGSTSSCGADNEQQDNVVAVSSGGTTTEDLEQELADTDDAATNDNTGCYSDDNKSEISA